MSIELSDSPTLAGLLALKAPLASPTFTGSPAVPTAAPGTNTTQAASTAFVAALVALATTGLLDLKGDIDCSSNPNYPAASKGDAYIVSVAGKVGGASGINVDVGDTIIASADNAGGTQAAVGTSWWAQEHNLAGALLSANNLSDVASAATARSNLGLAIGSDVQAHNTVLAFLAGAGSADAAGVRTLISAQVAHAVLTFLATAGSADAAGVRTLLGLDVPQPPIPSGRYLLPEGIGSVTNGTAPGANSIRMFRGYIRQAITITKLAMRVGTLSAGGNVQAAIYASDPSTGWPTGAPIVSTASMSTASTGGIETTGLSAAAGPGWYWFASNCDNGTAILYAGTTGGSLQGTQYGAALSTNVINSSTSILGLSKSHAFGTWPTLTGVFATDSLADVPGTTVPPIAYSL